MRINSFFSDYYDVAQHYNDDMVWNRRIIRLDAEELNKNFKTHHKISYQTTLKSIIIFCGKVYFLDKDGNHISDEVVDYIKYNELLKKYINMNHFIMIFEYCDKYKYYKRDFDKIYVFTEGKLNNNYLFKMKNTNLGLWGNFYTMFVDDNLDKQVYINHPDFISLDRVTLEKYNFDKVLTPEQCIQELDMFFNKVRNTENIPELDDITMRDIKGFDKHSFKKRKNVQNPNR